MKIPSSVRKSVGITVSLGPNSFQNIKLSSEADFPVPETIEIEEDFNKYQRDCWNNLAQDLKIGFVTSLDDMGRSAGDADKLFAACREKRQKKEN